MDFDENDCTNESNLGKDSADTIVMKDPPSHGPFTSEHIQMIQDIVKDEVSHIFELEDKRYLRFKIDFRSKFYEEIESLLSAIKKSLIFGNITNIVFSVLICFSVFYILYELIKNLN